MRHQVIQLVFSGLRLETEMKYLYSEKQNGFYVREIHGDAIPLDAVAVSNERREEILRGIPAPEESEEQLLGRAKAELRTMRAPMLDALTGIAGRATRAGNDALASEADALAEQLLDITDDAALNAATTYEDMQAAGVAAYKRMAASSSPELASVFREITGA